MDLLRFREPREGNRFKIIRPPSISVAEDTTTYSKNESDNHLQKKDPRELPLSPTEEQHINIPTDPSPAITPIILANDAALMDRVNTFGAATGDAVPTVPDEPIQETIVEGYIIVRWVSLSMFYVLRLNLISLIMCVAFSVMITWKISFVYALGLLVGMDLFELFQTIKHSKKCSGGEQTEISQIGMFGKAICKILAYSGTKTLMFLSIQSKLIPLALCFPPVIVYELVSSIIWHYKCKHQPIKTLHKIMFIFKIMISILCIMVPLKIEGLVQIGWRETLIPFWVLLAVLCVLSIISALSLMNRFLVYLFTDSEHFYIHGLLWTTSILAGVSGLSNILITDLREIFENNASIKILSSSLFYVISYNIGMLFLTLGYYTEIEESFKYLAAIEEEAEQTQTTEQALETKEDVPTKKPEKIIVPTFLTKSSSTYYRVSTDNEMKEVRRKKSKKSGNPTPKQKDKENQEKPPKKMVKKLIRHVAQKSADFNALQMIAKEAKKAHLFGHNHPPNNLGTIEETEHDRGTLNTEMEGRSMIPKSKREDKGQTFFSNVANRTGVVGIMPNLMKKLLSPREKKKEYIAQIDDGHDKENTFNKSSQGSIHIYRSMNNSRITDGRGNMEIKLRKTSRHELDERNLKALEARLNKIENENDGGIEGRRMAQSMYLRSTKGSMNTSGFLERQDVVTGSIVEHDLEQQKAVDTSMTHQCLICFDEPPDAVFMDCGHGGVCYSCSVEIWKATGECYLCRNQIQQVLQIDLKSKYGENVIKVLASTQLSNWDEFNEYN